MVQYVKPPELSEHIIDYRISRSPRGSLPRSAAEIAAKKKADRAAAIERMKAEAKKRGDYMRWLAASRGGR